MVAVGDVTGLLGLIRSLLLDRPDVKILIRTVDHAHPGGNFVAGQTGPWVHVEVHSTGRQPVRITSVGIELDDGQVVELDGVLLPKVLNRPDMLEQSAALDTLANRIRSLGPDRRARRVVVTASPKLTFRGKLPKDWKDFPVVQPKSTPGPPGGAMAGWV